MNIKRIGYIYIPLLCFVGFLTLNGQTHPAKIKKTITSDLQKQEVIEVSGKKVLQDTLYTKLIKEGWTREEALAIMDKIMGREMKEDRNSSEATIYRKFGRPYLSSNTLSGAGSFLAEHSTANVHQVGGALKAQAATAAVGDEAWSREFYDHTTRLRGRTPGRFRHAATLPASGRMEWAAIHPEDPAKIYCHPDGDGIWATADMGRTWRPISDNIPNRYHRSATTSYGIPVDPNDWNHLFAFVDYTGNPVYETFDGGSTWTLVTGASHKGFKRTYAFRNSADELIFIGAIPSGHYSGTYPSLNSQLWISKDKGVTWTRLDNNTALFPTSYKLDNPDAGNGIVPIGNSGYWFQEFCFHPTDKDIVWMPCMNAIFKTDNAFGSITKMTFNVYAADGTTLRSGNTQKFPFKATGSMMMNVNPNNPQEMWVALGNRADATSAVYKSTDGGANWTTLHEKTAGIGTGEKSIFQNEVAWVWLGGFGVNYLDQNKIWGTSMATAYSLNGGAEVKPFSWGNRLNGIYPDGNKYLMSVGSHNADNHFILSHKTGRLFRGCDTGILTLDPDANTEWYNIAGNMGQQLFAHLQCNEFGAQALIGNTQDCNAQTYRKGRWGKDRGYETATAWINSISSEEHFSGGWSTKLNMTNADYGSWSKGWSKADVCNGYWYLRRESTGGTDRRAKFFVVKDFGQVAISLDTVNQNLANVPYYVEDFALARDTKAGRVYVLTENNKIYYSDTQGSSFTLVKTLTGDYRCIAVNPLNRNEIYLGGNGILQKSTDGGNTFSNIYTGIPAGVVLNYIFYHEGTGDLYAVGLNDGVFYQQNGTNTWRLWMTGYNPAAFTTAMINYTTQEFVINDYGRGVWIADLERPADRFFSNLCAPADQFKLRVKELTNFNGKRSFGIDTYWTIPMYYKYEWYVDNVLVSNNNYQYLTNADVAPGQKVKLKLTLLESPDVSTWSEEYIVTNSEQTVVEQARGNAITSTRSGRVDLGYNDYFASDFTVDFWTKVNKDGVLISNRQKHENSAKGWYLSVESGILKFNYAPLNVFCRPLNETANAVDATWPSKTISAGTVNIGQWNHIAISQQTNGNIVVYVNGKSVLTEPRQMPEENLNNACNLSLFADAYGNNMIDASVDELRVWNSALSEHSVRKVMTTHTAPEGLKLLYQQSFNEPAIEQQKERFTQKGMQVRVNGTVSFETSPLSISGETVDGGAISTLQTLFTNGSEVFAKATFKAIPTNLSLYCTRYDDDFRFSPTGNLNPTFHSVYQSSFGIKAYNSTAYRNDSVKLSFYINPTQISEFNGQRLYAAGITQSKDVWNQIGKLTYNSNDQSIECTVKLSDIEDKELLLVKVNPSIELTLSDPKEGNIISINTPDDLQIKIKAQAVNGKTAPLAPYVLTCSNTNAVFSSAINFFNNEGTTDLIIPQSIIGAYGTTTTLTLSGDNQAIPLTIKVVNRIIPNANLKGLQVNQGGAILGDPGDFIAMDGSNTLSMACWVRLDNTSMLTGFHPILMVRGEGKSYGIHLEGADLRCHWNEESWSWSTSTGLRFTSDMIGKWVHVALVSDPAGITYYLNGRSVRVNRTMNPTGVKGALLILKNNDGDNSFIGAIDEISLWNKTLTQGEVIRLMHNAPVNNGNLVAFLNFERKDQTSSWIDFVNDYTLRTTGSGVQETTSSEIPFVSETQYTGLTGDQRTNATTTGMGINFGTSLSGGNFSLVRFNRLIKDVLNGIPTGFAPLSDNYFVLTTNQNPTTGNADIRIVGTALAINDEILIAGRPIGSSEALTILAQGTVSAAGVIDLNSTASLLTAKQLAVYHKSATAGAPMVSTLSTPISNNGKVILKEGENAIPLHIKWISGGRSQATIYLSSPFASIDGTGADLTLNTSADFTITINKENLNKFGWNNLQINATGAEPLNLQVALAPKIELSLNNGGTPNTYSSTNSIADLEINANLTEGVLESPLEFSVNSTVASSLVMSMGSLLSESSIKTLPLSYNDGGSIANSGWALIGNPYLANINLTQQKNVTGQNTGRFVYPYDPITRNYKAVDMFGFDAEQKIAPFSTFFVQSLGNNATLAIHAEAKTFPQAKGTRAIALTEIESIRLGLFAQETLCDEVTIRFSSNANNGFLPEEDAVKIWSYEPDVRGIGLNADGTILSVGAFVQSNNIIPLVFNIPANKNADLSIRVLDMNISGNNMVYLETPASQSILLNSTSQEAITLANGGIDLASYAIRHQMLTTKKGLDEKQPYKVLTEGNRCTVINLKGNAHILIFDTNGKLITDRKTQDNSFSVDLASGTFLVKLLENGKEFTATFIIK